MNSINRGVPPSGVVTFLFDDIEGSTHRREADADGMRAARLAHDDVLRTTGWKSCAWSALLDSQSGRGLDAEFLVDLRPVLETVWSEQNPVVNFAVGQYEADRGPLGRGFLLQDKHVGCE